MLFWVKKINLDDSSSRRSGVRDIKPVEKPQKKPKVFNKEDML
jgi:hypothetical protein